MSLHARPHLETHTRRKHHSAVRGAAYRLGLRLYDERAKQWCDFRKRKIGEEIVRSLTVAPVGAPAWATDPEQLWNRVEWAENRADSQLARDYRIPIPLGLGEKEAGDLAEEMARFIAEELTTAVSMGLHRDGAVDSLGELKATEKRGYHAHLYFPTRRLEEMEDDEGTSTWGLGDKLDMLSNKRTSAVFVEQLNAKWAELANTFTAANNLPADYDHKSYVRQGLPIEPRRTISRAAVAMQRKQFFARNGDAQRDIVVPSEAFNAVHAIVLEVQHERAVADVAREAATAGEPPTPALEPVVASSQPPEVSIRPPSWSTSSSASLSARFRATLATPTTPEAQEAFVRVLKIVHAIERALSALVALTRKLRDLVEHKDRRMAAKLDVTYQLDEARARRASADQKAKRWERDHPLRAAAAKAFKTGEGGKPSAWQTLINEVQARHRHVQSLKATVRSHQASLDVFGEQEAALEGQQAEAKQRLHGVLGSLVTLTPEFVEPLLTVTNEVERGLVEGALPERAQIPIQPSDPEPDTATPRLRPSIR